MKCQAMIYPLVFAIYAVSGELARSTLDFMCCFPPNKPGAQISELRQLSVKSVGQTDHKPNRKVTSLVRTLYI